LLELEPILYRRYARLKTASIVLTAVSVVLAFSIDHVPGMAIGEFWPTVWTATLIAMQLAAFAAALYCRRLACDLLLAPLTDVLATYCHACGYDLRGNADPTLCPECGAKQFVAAAEATAT
jgi:hypothetical protein